MMTFTDKDLKNLKSRIKEADKQFLKETKLVELTARLEAAEKVIKESFNHEGIAFIGFDSWHEAYEEWQKAKGVE